jgi:DNA mismatch repair protein MutL
MSIKVLPPEIVARIAAGEVVERPASVVKELVENAIDASATEITVEIEGSGTALIRVSDNGTGILSSEMALVLGRHATSKIASLDDLENITTLGFRGEALPSIASVADLEIISHARDEAAGHFMSVKDGTATEGSRGRSPGTTITVRNLFRRVPARLKFLKSAATETSRIVSVVSQYALCYPEIKFTLTVNGRVTLRTPGTGKLADAVTQVFGNDIAKNMLAIRENADNTSSILVTGMVGSPNVSRNTADYISFFVNRRWIVSRLLVKAAEEAYHGLIMVGKHPAAVINIFLPPSDVDVNIHPAKTEIKFRDEHAIFGAVERAVRQSLLAETAIPDLERNPSPSARGGEGIAEAVKAYNPERQIYRPYPRPFTGRVPVPSTLRNGNDIALSEPAAPRLSNMLPVLRVVGQVMGNYILAEGPDGLYIIDQHAAHERILFEKLSRENIDGGNMEMQGLLEPFALDVAPRESAVIKTRLDYLKTLGFTLEPFGVNTYLVRAVPAVVAESEWKEALTEILDTLTSGDRTEWREKIAASLACHSAVRSGKLLSEKEMEALIRELEKTTMPMTCPHGRPTVIRISKAQLEKDFGRS